MVMSYVPEIVRDETIYEVYIASLGEKWNKALAYISIKFGIEIQEVIKFKKNPRKLLFAGNAVEVFALRNELGDRGIKVKIEPEFKYDIFDDIQIR
jgi:hypothetical protein